MVGGGLGLGFRDGFGGGGWIVFGGAEGAHCGCCCVYLFGSLEVEVEGNPGREAPSTLYNCCFARLLLNFIVDRMNTMDYWRECIALGTTEKISWIYPSSSELNVWGRFQEPSRIKVRKCGHVEFEFLRRAGYVPLRRKLKK